MARHFNQPATKTTFRALANNIYPPAVAYIANHTATISLAALSLGATKYYTLFSNHHHGDWANDMVPQSVFTKACSALLNAPVDMVNSPFAHNHAGKAACIFGIANLFAHYLIDWRTHKYTKKGDEWRPTQTFGLTLRQRINCDERYEYSLTKFLVNYTHPLLIAGFCACFVRYYTSPAQ